MHRPSSSFSHLSGLAGVASLCLLTSFGLSLTTQHAADFHVTPQGAGSQDGTTWENAAAGAKVSAIFNDQMQAGDRLLLGGGEYKGIALSLSKSGEKGKPKTIQGETKGGELPVLSSSWTIEKPDKGATAVSLGAGLSHVTLSGLRIKGYCFGVRANVSAETARIGLTFEDVDVEQARHPFYLSDCDDLLLSGCDLKRYSKHGFRLDQGCNGVTFRKCVADCSEGDADWETRTEVFPFGFTANNSGTPNSGIVFEDCIARNNIKSNQKVKYTNGDGFVIEANTTAVTFRRCHALRNQDGGFDLKVKDVTLTDCVAIGHRRDFRIWTTGTLTNCFAGWSTTGLWTKGGPVTAKGCTFYAHRGAGAETEDAPGPLILVNCLIYKDPANAKAVTHRGIVELQDSIVTEPASANADPKWNGEGPAMDSATNPSKGYSSKRIAVAKK